MIKQFDARFIHQENNLNDLSLLLGQLDKQLVDNLLWTDINPVPAVSFSMAYSNSAIYLKFFAEEKFPYARHTAINDPVYKDSCVEFFIALNGSNRYYNFEFNCIGTPYIGYGTGRNDRIELPVETVKEIKVYSEMNKSGANGLTAWQLTLQIPFSVFIYDGVVSLKGKACRANFYKCGDELPEPHFMSWNNIVNSQPDFHLSEFFGEIEFV